MSPTHLRPGISVRARIIILALVPVIGFLANGVAFTLGKVEVDRAFEGAEQAAVVADASREFKVALTTIRMAAKEFATSPTYDLITSYGTNHDAELHSLDTIESRANPERRGDIDALRAKVAALKVRFGDLVSKQQDLGFEVSEGLRERLSRAGTAVERFINEDLGQIAEADAKKLLISLLTMRRYEVQYRQNRIEFVRQRFAEEFANFNHTFESVDGAPDQRDRLIQRIRTYADTFEEWALASAEVRPLVLNIDRECEGMLSEADKIILRAQEWRNAASQALSASQRRTKTVILSVGFASVFIGLCFSYWLGRSITRPLNGLADAMKRLAAGDTAARIPATQAKDEIGQMARAVIVFRDTTVERERLAKSRANTNREREQRGEVVATTITRFEMSVDHALAKVREAAGRLEITSTQLNGAADSVSAEARTAEARVGIASGNVTAAASGVEELAASIGEIAGQANRSTEVAARAVEEARRTVRTLQILLCT
jgi:methyl-accepting chemotaxis protein